MVWSLVESDAKAMSMLNDVRKAIEGNADRNERLLDERLGSAKEGTKAFRAGRQASSTQLFAPGAPVALDAGPSKGPAAVLAQAARRPWREVRNERLHYLFGPVINPDSRFRMAWNVMLALLICYCGIAVPLEIAFETDMASSMCRLGPEQSGAVLPRAECPSFITWWWANFLVDLFFIADIFVNLRTGFIQEGHFVNDDWLAARNYLRGSLWIDCLGSFPINLVQLALSPANPYGTNVDDSGGSGGEQPSAARVNRLLRLIRLSKLTKLARMFKLAKYLEGAERIINPGMLAVIKLVTFSLLCCHWFGCLWWLISELERLETDIASPWYAGDNGWLVPVWLKHSERSFFVQYMHAFFWGAGMVTSMVPYDIEPVTGIETLVTTFTMFWGLMLNALVISSLTTALASMDSKRELTGKQLDLIRNYLLIKGVPADLRSRVLEYYQYLFTSSAALADLDMFSNMPPALNAQLNLSVNRKFVARCAFFRDVSNASLVTLIAELQPLVFVPGQTIIVQGHALRAVYFINKGMVQLWESGTLVATLRDNDNFGLDDYRDLAMQTGDAVSAPSVVYTCRALTYCDVMSLDVERLVEVMAADDDFQRKVRESRQNDAGADPGTKHAKGKHGKGMWKRGGLLGSMGASTAGKAEANSFHFHHHHAPPHPSAHGGAECGGKLSSLVDAACRRSHVPATAPEVGLEASESLRECGSGSAVGTSPVLSPEGSGSATSYGEPSTGRGLLSRFLMGSKRAAPPSASLSA